MIIASSPNMSASAPLDILIIGMHFPPEQTGNAPYTAGLVDALVAAGHRVRVITGYPHYPAWRRHPDFTGVRRHEDRGGARVTRVRHPVPASPTALRRAAMDATFTVHAMAAAACGRRPDVVIVVSPVLLSVLAGLRWRSAGRTALGVITQDLYFRAVSETGILPGAEHLVRRLESALLRQADGIAVAHDSFCPALVGLGVDPGRLTVVPNWSHGDAADSQVRLRARRALGWRDDEIIALHAGNMGLKQGLENVVHAARLADEQQESIRFVLLGNGSRRATLVAAGAGIDRLQFLDPLPERDFRASLAAADVLVLNEAPTVVEMSAPSKLTSYFSAGRPVVAACGHGGAAAAELCRSEAGVRIDPGRPQLLLDAVGELSRRPDRGATLGAAGRRYARDQLGETTAHHRYQRWVARLAADRRAADPQVPRPAGVRR